LPFSKGGAPAAFPQYVIMRIVVNRNIIIHGISSSCSTASKYTGIEHLHQRLCSWRRRYGSRKELASTNTAAVEFGIGVFAFH
jgi:hypothetical protein